MKLKLSVVLIMLITLIIIGNFLSKEIFVKRDDDQLANIETGKENYSTAYFSILFDELDDRVNKGKGYSEYLNTGGFPTGALLAWSESYLMQSYVTMYRATGDVKYLNKLHNHIESVLANRDDKTGQRDYKNELVPNWGTDRYTQKGEWLHFAAHTGMITFPIIEFVHMIRELGIEKDFVMSDIILQQVKQSIEYHNKEWKNNYYVYPEDFYDKENMPLPLSQQAAIARSLLFLYELTGEEKYLNKVSLIAELIKDSLQDNGSGGYIVGTFSGKITNKNKVVDISHATTVIHFAYLAYCNDIIFNKQDMERFTKTIQDLAEANNNHFPKYLDGTGNFDYEVTAGQYAFLAEFNEDIYDSITDLLFDELEIASTAKYMQEDWWGTVMLGLSRIVSYQSSIK